MDQFELFKAFVHEAGKEFAKRFDLNEQKEEPKQDAFWDRLLEVLDLGPNGTKAEVIELVNGLVLERGYAKLKADKDLEKENKELKRQISELNEKIRAHHRTRMDVRDEIREYIKGLKNWSNTYITDIDNKLSEL